MPGTGTCTVTPALTWSASTPVNAPALNLAAAPVVAVADEAIGARQLHRPGVVEVLGSGASGYNYVDNPNFAENRWRRGATTVSCEAGVRTFRADQWWANPAGAPISYARLEAGPSNGLSVHCAVLTGDTSVTTVDFGQDIPRRIGKALARKLVLSFYLYNETGATLTPLVRVDTCDAADNFNAVTNRFAQALTPAPDSDWTFFELAIDATNFTNMAHGLQVLVRLPSGAMNAATKKVRFAQMKLEAADGLPATPFVVEREKEEEDGSATENVRNLLVNGLFEGARFLFPGTTGPVCSTGVRTANAEGWWVSAAGAATLTYTRSNTAPGTGDGASGFAALAAKLTGATSITTVDFGQTFGASQAALLKQDMVLSLWVKYTDGAAGVVTPHLVIDTCDSIGSFAALTNRRDAALQPCADGVWTRLTYQFDGAGVTNLGNGARLYLHFASGDLDAGTKSVEIAEALLEAGVAASALQPYVELGQAAFAQGAARGLVIDRSATATVRINADEIVLRHMETGRPIGAPFTNVTAADGSSGAGGVDSGSSVATGWWYVWAIHTGTTANALLSQSATNPTMPAGYVYRALVGVAYATDANTLRDFYQHGNRHYCVAVEITKAGSLAASWTDLDTGTSAALSTAVPPNAASFFGIFGASDNENSRIGLAATSAGAHAALCNVNPAAAAYDGFRNHATFDVPLRTAQKAWYQADNSAVDLKVRINGFILK